jgi:hypothetical protein
VPADPYPWLGRHAFDLLCRAPPIVADLELERRA